MLLRCGHGFSSAVRRGAFATRALLIARRQHLCITVGREPGPAPAFWYWAGALAVIAEFEVLVSPKRSHAPLGMCSA